MLNVQNLGAFDTVVRMCAARSGQLLNLSSLGADCGITHNTARAWLSVLEASYLVVRVPPHATNLGKRLVKSPKLHFLDSGLLCYLLGIRNPDELRHHSARGSIFESWVVAEVLKAKMHRGIVPRLSFFRDRQGNEVDLLVEAGGDLIAIEAKSGETIADDFFGGIRALRAGFPIKSGHTLRTALVYGGREAQARNDVRVVPWDQLPGFEISPPNAVD